MKQIKVAEAEAEAKYKHINILMVFWNAKRRAHIGNWICLFDASPSQIPFQQNNHRNIQNVQNVRQLSIVGELLHICIRDKRFELIYCRFCSKLYGRIIIICPAAL